MPNLTRFFAVATVLVLAMDLPELPQVVSLSSEDDADVEGLPGQHQTRPEIDRIVNRRWFVLLKIY